MPLSFEPRPLGPPSARVPLDVDGTQSSRVKTLMSLTKVRKNEMKRIKKEGKQRGGQRAGNKGAVARGVAFSLAVRTCHTPATQLYRKPTNTL